MADPLRPSWLTKVRAKLGGERDATLPEALRVAGRVAYEELLAADQLTTSASHRLAAWNAFVLQTLGEQLLDTDYSANPGTVGFVPPVVYGQAARWLSAVEDWVSRARQARANPDYDISREIALPARLPPWAVAGRGTQLPEHLNALLAAVVPVREHVEVALFTLETSTPAQVRRPTVNRLRQLAAEAAAATDYAIGLHTRRHHPVLHQLIESNLERALELWFHTGQLAAMPGLLDRRHDRDPDGAARPGGTGFDPWCLTDPATRGRRQRDPRAVRAIKELWQWDPDPAATLALQAEVDAALLAGDVVPLAAPPGDTCYHECPWAALYVVRRPVWIGGRELAAPQQFTLEVAVDHRHRGSLFRRGVVLGPFRPTGTVHYGI